MTTVSYIPASPYVETTIPNPAGTLNPQQEALWLHHLIKRRVIAPDYYMLYRADDRQEIRIVANPLAIVTMTAEKLSLSRLDTGETIEQRPGPHPLKQVEQLLTQLSLPGAIAYGYIAFELAQEQLPESGTAPLLTFFVPSLALHITPDTVRIQGTEHLILDEVIDIINSSTEGETFSTSIPERFPISEQDSAWYMNGVQTLTDAIRRALHTNGPLQKAILSRQVIVSEQGDLDLLETYHQATEHNIAIRSYCCQLGEDAAVGCSPETLLEADGDGTISSNPLAGTRWRGKTPEEDEALSIELAASHKQRTEHLLSVLEVQRELEAICLEDSVYVHGLAHIQKYRTVQHLASRLSGKLAPPFSVWDAVRVLFPGVTVSGIGKQTALEWIRCLEPTPRGMYAGAIGWIGADGSADLAIAIRTIFQHKKTVFFQAGAGIVADSEPRDEYEETWHKMQTMWPYFVRSSRAKQGDDTHE